MAYLTLFIVALMEWPRRRTLSLWKYLAGLALPTIAFLIYGAVVAARAPYGSMPTLTAAQAQPAAPGIVYFLFMVFATRNVAFDAGEMPFRVLVIVLLVWGTIRTMKRSGFRGEGDALPARVRAVATAGETEVVSRTIDPAVLHETAPGGGTRAAGPLRVPGPARDVVVTVSAAGFSPVAANC